MQTIATTGKHVAQWGGYQVVIYKKEENPMTIVVVRGVAAPHTTYLDQMETSTEAAIEAGAKCLEGRGCQACEDKRQRPLSDFLVFVPSGV